MDTKKLNELSVIIEKSFQGTEIDLSKYGFMQDIFRRAVSGKILRPGIESIIDLPESRTELVLNLLEASEMIKLAIRSMPQHDASEAEAIRNQTDQSITDAIFDMK